MQEEESMKKLTLVGALAIVALIAAGAGAADTKTAVHKAATKSLTGCLEKGDEANTFKLTHVEGGGDWELVGAPAALKMSEHVGHKVEVSGMSISASAAEKAEHAGEKKETAAQKKDEKKAEMKED